MISTTSSIMDELACRLNSSYFVEMVINRWQAPIQLTKEQISLILQQEGLEVFTEELLPNTKIPEHRHPFTEVRIVAEGELLISIAGTQLLLRSGDRIEIPANTKHWHLAKGDSPCQCVCSFKAM